MLQCDRCERKVSHSGIPKVEVLDQTVGFQYFEKEVRNLCVNCTFAAIFALLDNLVSAEYQEQCRQERDKSHAHD